MVTFPNCKINLGLHVIGKRNDGYHNLKTVFYPLQLKDAIEIIEKPGFKFSTSGLNIEGRNETNLCVKAYNLLKKDFPDIPAVQMHLHKAIPMGAGLGGGSADGTFTLKLLNKKFNLSLTEKQLIDYSLQLGSDCPFFIINKPCYATGRGEILEEIKVDLSNYIIVLVHPGIHISTAEAFLQLSGLLPRPDSSITVKEIIQQPISSWKDELTNDFEEPVFKKHPEIKKIKNDLYNAGAIYASMSGSGSAVYGIFHKSDSFQHSFSEKYFIKIINN
jgi:4-diphosphocytidyl-2-C-methyl-D-erythritol kinase